MNIEKIIRDVTEGPIVNLTGQILALATGAVIVGVKLRDKSCIEDLLDPEITSEPYLPCVDYDSEEGVLAFHPMIHPLNDTEFRWVAASDDILLHVSDHGGRIVGFTRGAC